MLCIGIKRRKIMLRLGVAIELTDVEDISVVDSGVAFILLTVYGITKSRRRV